MKGWMTWMGLPLLMFGAGIISRPGEIQEALGAVENASHEMEPQSGLKGSRFPRQQELGPRPDWDVVLAAEGWPLFRLLGRFLPEAGVAEIESLAEHWGYQVDEPRLPAVVWKLLLARWLELDPAAALACERRLDHYSVKGFAYATWVHLDYESALAAALREDPPNYRAVIDEVSLRDPLLALSWIEQGGNRNLVQPLMSRWGREDPDAALAALDRLSEIDKQRGLVQVIKAIALTDPERALEMSSELEGRTRHGAVAQILEALMVTDSRAFRKQLESLPPGKVRSDAFSSWVKKQVREDSDAAWTWALSLPSGAERQEAIFYAAEGRAGMDSKALLDLLDSAGWENALVPANRLSIVRQGGGYSRTGHDGMLQPAVRRALEAVAKDDPEAALAYLAKVPRDHGIHERIENPLTEELGAIGKVWLAREPFEMLEWVQGIPDPDVQADLARDLLGRGDAEASRAVEEYLVQASAGPVSGELSRWLLLRKASNPDEALALLETLDQKGVTTRMDGSDAGLEVYGAVVRDWFHQDPREVSEWVAGLPAGARKDAAIDSMASRLAYGDERDFAAAFEWAQVVQNEIDRERKLASLWQAWRAQRPEEAEMAIEASSLSEPLKSRIRGEEAGG